MTAGTTVEKSFMTEFFSYPSTLWLALQGVLFLSVMAWASFFLSWIAGLMVVIFAVVRARNILSKKTSPFANPRNIFITGASRYVDFPRVSHDVGELPGMNSTTSFTS